MHYFGHAQDKNLKLYVSEIEMKKLFLRTLRFYPFQETVRDAFKIIAAPDGARILDAGSGFGGCARFWAQHLGKSHTVVACEYNSEFSEYRNDFYICFEVISKNK